MNICASVKRCCKKLCSKKISIQNKRPMNESNESSVQEKLNTKEPMPNLSHQQNTSKEISTKQKQKRTSESSESFERSTDFDDFPNFKKQNLNFQRRMSQTSSSTSSGSLRIQQRKGHSIFGLPPPQQSFVHKSSSASSTGIPQRQQRKGHSIFGLQPSQQPLVHKSSSSYSTGIPQRQHRKGHSIFGLPPSQQTLVNKSKSVDSNVNDKIAEPKKRSSKLSDPVRNKWANKGAMVYSAYTKNHRQSKPAKYWVHTELQYIIMLPMDKPKKTTRKTNFDLTEQPSKEFPEREKENFDDLESSSSDSNESFIPRSQAKPAPKPKGRFCCAKRQASE